MMKISDILKAPFKGAAQPANEDETMALVETAHYLQDASIATTRPYYSFASLDDALPLLGLNKNPTENKPHKLRTMEIHSHHDHLNNVKTFVLAGAKIEMTAVVKKPGNDAPFQLDAIIINEGVSRICLACGPEDASRECVDLFLTSFIAAAKTLQNGPSDPKKPVESDLVEFDLEARLKLARWTLNTGRVLHGIEEKPSPSIS